MNKKIYLLAFIALFGWSCSKETENLPDTTEYDVTFMVTGFETFTENIPSTKIQSVSAQATFPARSYVDLFIYDGEGKLVKRQTENCCGAEGGLVVRGLPIGFYTVVAVGHNSLSGLTGSGFELMSTASVELESHDPYYGELFMGKVDFELKKLENNAVSIVLERKVAMLTVDITDTPPSAVYHVRATIPSMSRYYPFFNYMPIDYGYSPSITYPFYQQPDKFNLSFFVPFNADAYATPVLLEVLGREGEVLKSRTINTVMVGTNVRTTIRGKLFEPGASGFSVDIDTSWNGENNMDF